MRELIVNKYGLNDAHIYNCVSKKPEHYQFSFLDGQKIEDMPKPPPGRNQWENRLNKMQYYDYSKDLVAHILNERIGFLLDYNERFLNGKLTEKELNKPKPDNFKGPYLPVPAEIENIRDLVIEITWEPSSTNLKDLVTPGNNKCERYVDGKDAVKLVKQWKAFQEEYGIYDPRPLLGVRCGIVYRNEDGEVNFIFYRLLKDDSFKSFLLYMAKDFPDLLLSQIQQYLNSFCDYYIDGQFHTFTRAKVTGLELNFIDVLREKYAEKSSLFHILSVVIGERIHSYYGRYFTKYVRHRDIPFVDGPWKKEEELQLLYNMAKYHQTTDLDEIISCQQNIQWSKIFENIKVRSLNQIYTRWHTMRQELKYALYHSKGQLKERWTSEDTIKLIDTIYHSNARTIRSLNWEELTLTFPGYSDTGLRSKLNSLLLQRVPFRLRKKFDDSMEYLYHKIKPVYKIKDIRQKRINFRLDMITNYQKGLAPGTVAKLKNYFEKVDEDEEEERCLLTREDILSPAKEENEADQHPNNQPNKRNVISSQFFWQVLMDRGNYKSRYYSSGEEVTVRQSDLSFVPMANEFSSNNDRNCATNTHEEAEFSLDIEEQSPEQSLGIDSLERGIVTDTVTEKVNHSRKEKKKKKKKKCKRKGDEISVSGQTRPIFQEDEIGGSCSLYKGTLPTEGDAIAIFKKKKPKHQTRKEDSSPVNTILLDHRERQKKEKQTTGLEEIENPSYLEHLKKAKLLREAGRKIKEKAKVKEGEIYSSKEVQVNPLFEGDGKTKRQKKYSCAEEMNRLHENLPKNKKYEMFKDNSAETWLKRTVDIKFDEICRSEKKRKRKELDNYDECKKKSKKLRNKGNFVEEKVIVLN